MPHHATELCVRNLGGGRNPLDDRIITGTVVNVRVIGSQDVPIELIRGKRLRRGTRLRMRPDVHPVCADDADRQTNGESGTRQAVRPFVLQLENAPDAIRHQPAGGGRRQERPITASRLESNQRIRVEPPVAAYGERRVVARVLTFGADPCRRPPDRWMVEEQRLGDRRDQVDEEVVAADVCQFVSENRLDLHWAQAGQRGDWKQHHRFQPSYDRWSIDERRLDDVDGARR